MVFPIVGGRDPVTRYQVSNGARFYSNTDLKRLPSATGSSLKATLSVWVKFASQAGDMAIAGGWDNSGANDDDGYWVLYRQGSTGRLIFEGGTDTYLRTNATFRDVSAWYHVVLAIDSTQNDNNAQRLYINGEELTSFAGRSNLTNLQDLPMNTTAGNDDALLIGCDEDTGGKGLHFDGYMCEFFWIDGTQYAASDFGELDTEGQWVPKKGEDVVDDLTMGTNGVYLEFKQTGTSANSSGIGADTSGNDNHFTVTNLAANDRVQDTCTNNFATLNQLFRTNLTSLEGATEIGNGTDNNTIIATQHSKAGYFEFKYGDVTLSNGAGMRTGIVSWDDHWGRDSDGTSLSYNSTGDLFFLNNTDNSQYRKHTPNTTTNLGTDKWSAPDNGDIISVAWSVSLQGIWFAVNGTWYNGSGSASTTLDTSNPDFAINDKQYIPIFISSLTGGTGCQVNFGNPNPSNSISSGNSDANGYGNFEYAVPSGFYALCTENMAQHS
tara:strand:- start:260 stop:1741 length:1482 start_codon:yes stop_codon:yes gene_type:complete